MPVDDDSGLCGIECYYTTRTVYREVHVSELKADDGFREINAASCDLEQRYANLVYVLNKYYPKCVNNQEWYKGLFMISGFDDGCWQWYRNSSNTVFINSITNIRYSLHKKGFVWDTRFSTWMYKGDVR